MVSFTYFLGFIEHEKEDNIVFLDYTYELPDDAMCGILDLVKGKLGLDYKDMKPINFFSASIEPFKVIKDDGTYLVHCSKNFLEEVQIKISKKCIDKGYLYNGSSYKKILTFFFRQYARKRVELDIKPEVVEAFKELKLIDEIKEKIRLNSLNDLKKIEQNEKKDYESDFKKELRIKVAKKQRKLKKH